MEHWQLVSKFGVIRTMAKGKRKTIILNPDNPKEKIILDYLDKQYNSSEFIKTLLFNYIQNNNNLHDDNTMVNVLSHNDHSMTNVLPSNDNKMTIQSPHDDNSIINELPSCDNSDFLIDISNISDEDANINMPATEDPSKNALDFLKNSF